MPAARVSACVSARVSARVSACVLLLAGCGGDLEEEPAGPPPLVFGEAEDLADVTETLLGRCGRTPRHVFAYRWTGGTISGTVRLSGEDGDPVEQPLMPGAHGLNGPLTDAGGHLVAVVFPAERSGDEFLYPVEVFGSADAESGPAGVWERFRPVRGTVRGPGGLAGGVTQALETAPGFAARRLSFGDREPFGDPPGWLTFRVDRLPPPPPAEG